MVYQGCIIKKVKTDLGEDNESKNCIYEIYKKDGTYMNVALTISTAKEYISSGFNANYL